MSKPIYLDYAAATPMDLDVLAQVTPLLTDDFYNPSAVYQSARLIRKTLEDARATVANVLGAKDQEVIFTAGGTEANNIAIHGIMRKFPEGNIVVSSIEHESVLEPAKKYERRVSPVTKKGLVDLEKLELMIDENTVLVSVMYANNEIGTIQSLKNIAAIIQKKRKQRTANNELPLYFHTDACQAANYFDLQVQRLGVDLMTLNGGKIYGMKQSGCLYIKTGTLIDDFVLGGGQERGIRSGTENVAAIVAFATMLQKVQETRKGQGARLQKLSSTLFANLSQNIPDLSLNGDIKNRLPNNINITIPSADGERLLMELDNAGLLVATGSACTASNDEPSHVLLALGLSEADAAASLRITLGRPTTELELTKATEILTRIIKKHLAEVSV